MSEIEDLMGLWGAIDQAVVANPEGDIDGEPLAEVVGRFLGPYRDGAAGWFDEFTAWTAELMHVEAEGQYPERDEALRNLAETPARGRRRARRLHVIAVAARLFPELREGGHELHESAIGALTQGIAPDPDAAEQLLQLLTDDDVFPDLGRWEHLLVTARGAELIDEVTFLQATAPPCSGELVSVTLPGGDIDPVPTLSTHFCTTALTIEEAKRFLEPVNWPDCNDFWCEMTLQGSSARGNPTYHEKVSVACSNQYAWVAETDLEFAMVNLPNGGALVSYNLCDGLPHSGDAILVDSGSLLVVQNGSEVCVSTTKRILFNHPFSGPSLAALSCALGYGAVAEDLVFTCALEPGNPNENPGTEFPGVDPPNNKRMFDKEGPVMVSQPSTAAENDADCMKGVIDDAVDAAKDCIDACADAYHESYKKISDRSYKADDVVQDVAAMWTRLLRDGARALDLGLRASRAAAVRTSSAKATTAAPPTSEKE